MDQHRFYFNTNHSKSNKLNQGFLGLKGNLSLS